MTKRSDDTKLFKNNNHENWQLRVADDSVFQTTMGQGANEHYCWYEVMCTGEKSSSS